MKICITCKGKTPKSPVEKNFGRTPFLALYDEEKKAFEFVENTHKDDAGGVGPKTAQLIADTGALVVITGMIGDNARKAIDIAEIETYKQSAEASVEETIEAFQKGDLKKF
ncbi:dinitrogenase iron-molybdenum cofactor biosynthesis protein [Methanoplanus sp. FWC-SCC4]|uniref:Dinitrogenase iron-molybdenum cofactor biosynthesis protein n=1 Tax=Methanochimaera problematica TaxID=2609417 RepID=A0AA97I449_9EURY|nr:NifB/NifX family molybdenum-iron cluster-binding protein [Methanoplanus sp. FWC-SCC4]WOF16139.1 dinitrogenase iron-molybdenum cofactor biosynthesis protein [Methanoplanus sp. FWC-SCC4]